VATPIDANKVITDTSLLPPTPFLAAELSTGDVLYVPRGWVVEVLRPSTKADNDPPYYTIRLDRSNKEKQTDARNLTPLFEDEVYDADKGSKDISDDAVTGKSERKRCPLTTMRPVFTADFCIFSSLYLFPPCF
jgi:hypothetical protein